MENTKTVWTFENLEKLAERRFAGETVEALAAELGLSLDELFKLLRAYNVQRITQNRDGLFSHFLTALGQ